MNAMDNNNNNNNNNNNSSSSSADNNTATDSPVLSYDDPVPTTRDGRVEYYFAREEARRVRNGNATNALYLRATPVLEAGRYTLRVSCPHCWSQHDHGSFATKAEAISFAHGHRASHCFGGGYWLEEAP